MSDYRFSVSEHDGTIHRAKAYRLPDEWTTDSWENYFDGDGMVGFTVDYLYGPRHLVPLHNDDENRRAVIAYENAGLDGLDRLAPRLALNEDARFIHVGLDRSTDFYVLAWGGDPDGEWRDEIEAVYHGDIWRFEIEEYAPGLGPGGSDWITCDDYPEEFYGEEQAQRELVRVFDLDAFPAEMFVGSE